MPTITNFGGGGGNKGDYYHLILTPAHNGQVDYGGNVYLICEECIDGVITRRNTYKGWNSTSKMTIDGYQVWGARGSSEFTTNFDAIATVCGNWCSGVSSNIIVKANVAFSTGRSWNDSAYIIFHHIGE